LDILSKINHYTIKDGKTDYECCGAFDSSENMWINLIKIYFSELRKCLDI
jgi:hypothetical protein